MKSYNKPTSEQLDAALPLLGSPQHEAYFFEHLENPNWIRPLKERGVFTYPPKAENVEGGGTRFPIWPQSKYLVRMAPHAPPEVASIFAEIETDNTSIIGDMLDAALAIPPSIAVSLVPNICRAAKENMLWIHFKNAVDLCVRLADSGEVDSAIDLAESLFTPDIEGGKERRRQRQDYWYKDGLKKVVPVLARRKPRVFVPRLCDWLKVAIEAKENVDPNSGSDYSCVWRPAIEEHEQNREHNFAGVLVGFVRLGFEEAIRSGQFSLEDAFEIIDGYSYLVFRRIKIHLVNEFADQNPELARQTLMDPCLFDDYKYKHEYARLVEERLPFLTPEERSEWFGWIDSGPDMTDFDESIKRRMGRSATDEDRQNRIHYWQYEKLHWVHEHLEGERLNFYKDMREKHDEPKLADLNVRLDFGHWGHDSPVTVDDLSGGTFQEAVENASSWRPEEPRFVGPTIEGLASTFRQYVATDPETFSAQADILIGKPAIYVREFIGQMAESAKGDCDIDVPAVLRLCHWVIEQPINERTTPEQEDEGALVDKDWQWTRNSISQFVENVCKAKNGQNPGHPLEPFRELIWRAISPLCQDEPDSNILRDTAEDDPRVQDYLDLAINSPRGQAVAAAFDYARWVANHICTSSGDEKIIPDGFDAIPEIREMLEWQIAPENRSKEALAIIGSRMSLLYWIDKKWLSDNACRLFDLKGIERTLPASEGWAAWNAFAYWVPAHIEFYRLFKEEYAYAVQQSADVELPEQEDRQPMERLGQGLLLLYGRGQLGLDDDEGLIRFFLEETNPDIRRHAMGFVGEILGKDESVPDEVAHRYMTLWDVYWAGMGKTDAEEKPDAFVFGTWFSSGKFPTPWVVERLEEFSEIVPPIEPEHTVAEELARVAPTDPRRSVRILDRMVRGDREGWRIHAWLDSARQILETAMKADEESQTLAAKLIDYLGRRGYTEFGELLGPS